MTAADMELSPDFLDQPSGPGSPMPSRRTLATGILPSARSKETSLRNPTSIGFLRRSIGMGDTSDP
jgi:hypothetical protein